MIINIFQTGYKLQCKSFLRRSGELIGVIQLSQIFSTKFLSVLVSNGVREYLNWLVVLASFPQPISSLCFSSLTLPGSDVAFDTVICNTLLISEVLEGLFACLRFLSIASYPARWIGSGTFSACDWFCCKISQRCVCHRDLSGANYCLTFASVCLSMRLFLNIMSEWNVMCSEWRKRNLMACKPTKQKRVWHVWKERAVIFTTVCRNGSSLFRKWQPTLVYGFRILAMQCNLQHIFLEICPSML